MEWPSVEESESGQVWIVTQASTLLRPVSHRALPGEVARRLPGILASRGLAVDLDLLDALIAREHTLAIGIDEDGITILTPEGRTHEPGQPAQARHGVEPDWNFCNTFLSYFWSFL